MSILEDDTPKSLDKLMTTGNKTTTTGVLFTKADTTATSKSKTSMKRE